MNSIDKTQLFLFLAAAFFVFVNCADAQNTNNNCFEVKYFDFFGLDNETKVIWADDELNKLLETTRSQIGENTSFLIPLIVFQLKDLHPNCNKSIDKKRFDKLVSLYFKIRGKDILILKNKTIAKQLDFIREDYYAQLQDERFLSHMRYTMDDGPLYGKIPKSIPKTAPLETIVTDFGRLSILELNDQIFLIATDLKDKIIWSRVMKGTNPDRYLKNLEFDEKPIEKTSLATIINFYSEGERLNLFLKPDGNFLYYYHSW